MGVASTHNSWGCPDNKYKARIKILVKAEGQQYIDDVEEEYRQIVEIDGGPHTIPQAEFDRVAACFVAPKLADIADVPPAALQAQLDAQAAEHVMFGRWLQRNVHAHQNPQLRAVTLSFKRPGQAPGDATSEQLIALADMVDQYSAGEARVTHDQNVLLPWVHASRLFALWQEAKALGLASANVQLLTDMIACPGGDFCALANARSLPIAEAITQRYQDLDELDDIGEIDLHISGCINSCGHRPPNAKSPVHRARGFEKGSLRSLGVWSGPQRLQGYCCGSVTNPILRTPARWAAAMAVATFS
eukprot:gene43058-53439_t